MTDGNLFPEISSDPEVEFDPDALSPDPDTITNPQNPVPDPGTIPAPQNLVSVTVAPEATTQIEQPQPPAPPEVVVETQTPPSSGEPTPLDGSIPPALPPEDFTTAASTPQGKRPSNFWLWAAPVLLLLLALFAVGVRAFIVGGIANVSLDVVRPRSGETVFLNQPVTVVARIRSSNGWSKANFYVNNQLLQSTPGMDANYDQELNFAWTPSSEGATMLRVLVTNKKGDQTATEDVAVMVIKGENGATITPVPAASPTTTLTPTKGPSPTPCTDLFEIIAESGLVQGTKMDVGRPFTKSWTVKNVGSCKWEKYKFVFESGSLLGALTPQPVPITDTGGTATLTLNLMSPSIAGNFIGKWRMQNAKGDIFGPELVYGLVIPSPTPTITPTKTDTPTPRPTNTLRPSITRTATKTFTPTSTATITPTFTGTPTQTDTATPTPTETPTDTPTPTYTTSPGPAKFTYFDDFSDINSGWPIGFTDNSNYGYLDGTYAILITTKNFLQPVVPIDYLGTGDALINLDAWKETSPDVGNFGIVCGYLDNKNYFIMGISSDGSVGVYQIADEKVSTLLYEENQFIPVDRYHLIANCQNGRFTLDVNGTIRIDLSNPILTSDGGVGIFGRALQKNSTVFHFDNFKAEQANKIASNFFRNLLSTQLLPAGILLKNIDVINPKN